MLIILLAFSSTRYSHTLEVAYAHAPHQSHIVAVAYHNRFQENIPHPTIDRMVRVPNLKKGFLPDVRWTLRYGERWFYYGCSFAHFFASVFGRIL